MKLSLDVKVSALTPNVVQVKNSLLRSAAKSRPVVKKSTLFPITVLNELYKAVIKPHLADEASINPSYFRSIVSGLTFYYTFCRFSDYVQLRDSDITDHGTYLRLNFRRMISFSKELTVSLQNNWKTKRAQSR